mmetsp:Transcript_15303/g.30476  ORF Transcript_15303/g.30476 Transcript_15303/m.30476 type:complete len:126 (-) Transcript_15303:320-697(-)
MRKYAPVPPGVGELQYPSHRVAKGVSVGSSASIGSDRARSSAPPYAVGERIRFPTDCDRIIFPTGAVTERMERIMEACGEAGTGPGVWRWQSRAACIQQGDRTGGGASPGRPCSFQPGSIPVDGS